jgi:hypothetical protein
MPRWRKTRPAAAGFPFKRGAGGEAAEGGPGESSDAWRRSGGERGGPGHGGG